MWCDIMAMSMSLREYLDWKKLGPEEFGALIGVSRTAVSRYLDGSRCPKREVLVRIAQVTGQKVTADSFFLTETGQSKQVA